MNRSPRRGTAALRMSGILLAAPLLLVGCSGTPAEDTDTAPTSEVAAGSEAVTLTDGWVKSGGDMSGVFGTLVNNGDTDIVLERAESPAAEMVELHETVTSGGSATMREVEGGFTIPAGGSFELVPGGNHIMFMDIPTALLPGDEVPVTLFFSDGTTVELTVLVKDFAGAQENYEGDSGESGDQDVDHSAH